MPRRKHRYTGRSASQAGATASFIGSLSPRLIQLQLIGQAHEWVGAEVTQDKWGTDTDLRDTVSGTPGQNGSSLSKRGSLSSIANAAPELSFCVKREEKSCFLDTRPTPLPSYFWSPSPSTSEPPQVTTFHLTPF